jgi:hypothetical protein
MVVSNLNLAMVTITCQTPMHMARTSKEVSLPILQECRLLLDVLNNLKEWEDQKCQDSNLETSINIGSKHAIIVACKGI